MAIPENLKNLISPHKQADKQFYLDLLDEDKQRAYEDEHLKAVLAVMKLLYLGKLKRKIKQYEEEKRGLLSSSRYDAEKYRRMLEIDAGVAECNKRLSAYKPFFNETYFARMDLIDDKDGYNSYYIGKRGDEGLEIVDWRAPLARKYYQKSQLKFSINDFNYDLVLRRALRTNNGKVIDFRNEYLSVGDNLTKEEIAGRDASVIFDPFLKDILSDRKDKHEICDIIETIQEKQYEIITAPEDAQFIVQGIAGSGKTMILLHRLSYLMYNDENIKPSNVLVITPSDSFNAFIDELSAILELERVHTCTLQDYFLRLLKSVGVDMRDKISSPSSISKDFLKFIYSPAFSAEVDKKLEKIYGNVRGMLPDAGSDQTVRGVLSACEEQLKEYEKIKNAGLRVRRLVLGEIKERPEGGLYYTKQMRALFNCVLDVREFLTLNSDDERMNGYYYFFRQFLSFYKSLKFIRRYGEKICLGAIEDLKALDVTLDKEILDLQRYKVKVGDKTELTYPDRIARRKEIKKEIGATISRVERILSHFYITFDFSDVVRGEGDFVQIGKCENGVDLARLFYKEIIKKIRQRYKIPQTGLLPCDPYCLCLILNKLGFPLTPRYSFVFVDEAQDIATEEYALLRRINDGARFNVFGDLRQNVTSFRGIKEWEQLNLPVYTLGMNYRNTNQIVTFVSEKLGVNMTAIGLDGDAVATVRPSGVNSYLSDKKGLRAVITTENILQEYTRKSYNVVRQTGVISKSKVNIMTVYESKGLEFSAVAVADAGMTDNEKYIAYTRALKNLAVIRP